MNADSANSTAPPPCILLIGLGDLGGVMLEFLLREPDLGRVVVASRDPRKGLARCNLARLSAIGQGFCPQVEFVPLDLRDEAATSQLVENLRPDLILLTATMQTWWLLDRLPAVLSEPLGRAGFGVWLPVHLALARHLMSALERVDYSGLTLTAPYPDVVNCVLGRLGRAPTCGIGNIAEVVARVQVLAAARLAVEPGSISVTMVAHHALDAHLSGRSRGNDPPGFLRVEHAGQDVTESLGGLALLRDSYPVSGGRLTHFLTAGTAIRLLRQLLVETSGLTHVPGPGGLPGGYPVKVSRQGVKPVAIPGLSLAEAIELNLGSLPFDGIDRIEPDGSVIFVPESADLMRDVLGYDCARLEPDGIESRAEELTARFQELIRRQGA